MIPSAVRMTTTFIHHPGLSGPFGALMDEYARAAEDFCRVVESFDLAPVRRRAAIEQSEHGFAARDLPARDWRGASIRALHPQGARR